MNASPTFPDFRTSLAQMGDQELAALLRARPDTSFPLPPGVNSLAARLVLPGSLSRAVRRLTALEIAALEAAGDLGAELEPVAVKEIVNALPVDEALAHESVSALRTGGLVFGTQDSIQVTPGALGALPTGWRVCDTAPENVEERIEQLDAPQRAVLDTLAASGSVGTTRDAAIDADPARPVPRLIDAGLLVRVNANTVRLPRPVRDVLRGQPSRPFPLEPSPRLTLEPTPNQRADDAATAAGLEATHSMRRLITTLGHSPVALNKDGSVGVRALTSLAKELEAPEETVALLVSVGESAGVLGRGLIDDDIDGLAPTKDAPAWSMRAWQISGRSFWPAGWPLPGRWRSWVSPTRRATRSACFRMPCTPRTCAGFANLSSPNSHASLAIRSAAMRRSRISALPTLSWPRAFRTRSSTRCFIKPRPWVRWPMTPPAQHLPP
ncbi:hypothetical protein [Corynebacterium pilosum]|uniref:hypothetical protein n=1 Tax=Corynebacterium pilosum TaxID=35756 RepID=UPI000ACAD4C3|nr:hypothetical protein [Corynebacterium pilosum]